MTQSRYRVERNSTAFDHAEQEFEVCVVGGGMAGLCAAIASARNGAKTVLIHDRPVLGGNASSEVRMWICGAHGTNMKETGILEEVQLENCYRNPTQLYSIWDSVLYEKAAFCENLTLMLNASCCGGQMDGARLESIKVWRMPSQTWHTIHARLFIDCSGDSILAPITGAQFRQGREAREEFDEDIEPANADAKTMGNSLLLQLRETDEHQPFIPPKWAYKFRSESDLPNRHTGGGHNFWWLELGGLNDTIRDSEKIRHQLMCVGYGVWDYMKNHGPKRANLEHWALEWMGSLPGKRENRRYVGGHILTQNDVRGGGGAFPDVIAYGGWSMDDHHPAGLLYPGHPTLFHRAPSPYGIPYRCLFSMSVPNLMMAGRNISVTHAALSSTRVMATTSLIGQAAGTAAAMCIRRRCDPASIYPTHIAELQQTLMNDDVWLPGVERPRATPTLTAKLNAVGDAGHLTDGHDRTIGTATHLWAAPLGLPITFEWQQPIDIAGVRLVLDSNLSLGKVMPCRFPKKGNSGSVPATMLRAFDVDVQLTDGSWQPVCRETNNYQRLVYVSARVKSKSVRITPRATWGAELAHVFSVDVLDQFTPTPGVREGREWSELVAEVPAADLAPPDSGLEGRPSNRSA